MDKLQNAFAKKKQKQQILPSWGYVQIANESSQVELDSVDIPLTKAVKNNEKIKQKEDDLSILEEEIAQQFALNEKPLLQNNFLKEQEEEEESNEHDQVKLQVEQESSANESQSQFQNDQQENQEVLSQQEDADNIYSKDGPKENVNYQAATDQNTDEKNISNVEKENNEEKIELISLAQNETLQIIEKSKILNKKLEILEIVDEKNLDQIKNLIEEFNKQQNQPIKTDNQILQKIESNCSTDQKEKENEINKDKKISTNENNGLTNIDYKSIEDFNKSIKKMNTDHTDKDLQKNLNKLREAMYKKYLLNDEIQDDDEEKQFLILELLNTQVNIISEETPDKLVTEVNGNNNNVVYKKLETFIEYFGDKSQQNIEKNDEKNEIQNQESQNENIDDQNIDKNENNNEINKESYNQRKIDQKQKVIEIKPEFNDFIEVFKQKYQDNDNYQALKYLDEKQVQKNIITSVHKNDENQEIYTIEYHLFRAQQSFQIPKNDLVTELDYIWGRHENTGHNSIHLRLPLNPQKEDFESGCYYDLSLEPDYWVLQNGIPQKIIYFSNSIFDLNERTFCGEIKQGQYKFGTESRLKYTMVFSEDYKCVTGTRVVYYIENEQEKYYTQDLQDLGFRYSKLQYNITSIFVRNLNRKSTNHQNIELSKLDYQTDQFQRDYEYNQYNKVLIIKDSIYYLQRWSYKNQQEVQVIKKKLEQQNQFDQIIKQEQQDENEHLTISFDEEIEFFQWDANFITEYKDKNDNEKSINSLFIIINSKQNTRIYNLNNPRQPIIIINDDFSGTNFSFVHKEQNKNYFCIFDRSRGKQIMFDCEENTVQKTFQKNDPNIKLNYRRMGPRIQNQQNEVLKCPIQLDMPKESFEQFFFIDYDTDLILIHPLNYRDSYSQIREQIIKSKQLNNNKNYSDWDNQCWMYQYQQKQTKKFRISQKKIQKILKDYEKDQIQINSFYSSFVQIDNFLIFLHENQTIVCVENKSEIQNDFDTKQEKKSHIFEKIYESYKNFDGDANFYLNESKKVISTHHDCFILVENNIKKYSFKKNYLLVQMQNIEISENKFSLIKLFQEDDLQYKNLKVLKYHLTEDDIFIFFEIAIEGKNISGSIDADEKQIYQFFVKAKQKIFSQENQQINFLENKQLEYLIFDGKNFITVDNKINEKSEEQNQKQEQDLNKFDAMKKQIINNKNKIYFTFEAVSELNSSNQNILPMIIYFSKDDKQIEKYLSFFNQQDYKLIQMEKLDFNQNKNLLAIEQNDRFRKYLLQDMFKYRSENLFCRVSKWNTLEGNIKYAEFIIGCSHVIGQTHITELRKYFIRCPHSTQSLINDNQENQLYKYFMQHKEKTIKYLTQIQLIIFKPAYSKQFRSIRSIILENNLNPIDKHRLLPKFNEKKEISGCYAFINQLHNDLGIYKYNEYNFYVRKTIDKKITTVQLIQQNEAIKQYSSDKDQRFFEQFENHKFNEFRKYDIIDISDFDSKKTPKNFISNEMFECSIQENEFAFLATSKYKQDFIDKINIEQINKDYQLYALAKKMITIKQKEYFEILNEDMFNEEKQPDIQYFLQPQIQLKGQNILYKILENNEESSKEQNIGDKLQSQSNEKLLIQKTLESNSDPKFKENTKLKKISSLFQELDKNKNDEKQINILHYIENSILNRLSLNYDSIQKLEIFFLLSQNFNFECDILNRRTLLEILYSNDLNQEFKKTINYIINNDKKHSNHRAIIQRNLLLLFHQNLVKIYQIFNLDKQYEEIQNDKFDEDYFSNIEQIINQQDNDLYEDGLRENKQWNQKITEITDNFNINIQDIISQIKIETQKSDYIKERNDNKQKLIKIIFSYVDFTSSFRQLTFEICLKKLRNQEQEQYKVPFREYIESYQNIYQDLDQFQCTDLMLAKMMTIKREDQQFYDEETSCFFSVT